MNKSEFIRSQPRHITAAEVVKAAKKARITISTAMVYSVRARPAPTRGRGRPRKDVAHSKPHSVPMASNPGIRRIIAATVDNINRGQADAAAPLRALIETRLLEVARANAEIEFVRNVLRLGGDLA